MDEYINLVADIGGTNLRIGIANYSTESSLDENCLAEVEKLAVYQCADFDSLYAIINDYLIAHQITAARVQACFAIACPVDQDKLSMTNLPWQFSQLALKQQLGFKRLTFINDYTAIAFSIPLLHDAQKVKIGQGKAIANQPIAICGPGTGLGVASLIYNGQWQCISGEGGHVDFAPTNDIEVKLLQYLQTRYAHVSYEQLLSGLGIAQIYQGLHAINGTEAKAYLAKDISEHAVSRRCEICQQTLLIFCRILGSFAGNLALTMGSLGGVYIAGGIAPRFIEFIQNSEFRAAFEAKGRFTEFNQKIPTFVITEAQPGMLGAMSYLRK